MNPNITVTADALSHIEKIITKALCLGLRLSVKKTGCSGYAYSFERVETVNEKDFLLELAPLVKIYIDSAWLTWFDGLKIDFVEEIKMGLKQKRLTFINTKESARCGCGESFQMNGG
ncbi:MAG: Iron-sulfur cluster assembly protein IscA [uncultured bacterium]|nr:MAG: Iron-sulfur cluster assembly protein IscA [uncultured bacterium]OGT55302.1 MAG: hypothetical protein A3F43_03540 [Gammaproteobacteria bacterium RIFCSPHIGHO2_12_FULL_42_10]